MENFRSRHDRRERLVADFRATGTDGRPSSSCNIGAKNHEENVDLSRSSVSRANSQWTANTSRRMRDRTPASGNGQGNDVHEPGR